jgi:hypothetical protein
MALSKNRKEQLDEYADWLQSEYMGHIENAIDVCVAISDKVGDELTLAEGNYIFEILGD